MLSPKAQRHGTGRIWRSARWKNEFFSNFIQRRKDNWKTGTDESHESQIEVITTKYHNMVKQGLWKQAKAKDSKIVALATNVQDLEAKLKAASVPSSSGSSSETFSGNKVKISYFTIEE